MTRLRVSQRLRGRLKALIKRGDQTALAEWSQQRPGGSKISQQELSYFLRDTEGRRGITLDDLDDLAAFFRVSIGELLGDTKPSQLTGDEQRMVYAFRALAKPTQDHFLAIIEAASVSQTLLLPAQKKRITEAQPHVTTIHAGRLGVSADSASGEGEDAHAELGALREWLLEIAAQIGAAATGVAPHRPLPSPRVEEAHGGRLAD